MMKRVEIHFIKVSEGDINTKLFMQCLTSVPQLYLTDIKCDVRMCLDELTGVIELTKIGTDCEQVNYNDIELHVMNNLKLQFPKLKFDSRFYIESFKENYVKYLNVLKPNHNDAEQSLKYAEINYSKLRLTKYKGGKSQPSSQDLFYVTFNNTVISPSNPSKLVSFDMFIKDTVSKLGYGCKYSIAPYDDTDENITKLHFMDLLNITKQLNNCEDNYYPFERQEVSPND